jgi:hypothetical protein
MQISGDEQMLGRRRDNHPSRAERLAIASGLNAERADPSKDARQHAFPVG